MKSLTGIKPTLGSTLQKQMGNSNPFLGVKILATQITHSLSWNDSGIVVVEIPSIFYG